MLLLRALKSWHKSTQFTARNQQLKSEKQKKLKSKNGMLRSIGKQSRESVELVRKKKRKATVGTEGFTEKEGFKHGMKEWGVMDDESGESMEPMEEVPLEGLSE